MRNKKIKEQMQRNKNKNTKLTEKEWKQGNKFLKYKRKTNLEK